MQHIEINGAEFENHNDFHAPKTFAKASISNSIGDLFAKVNYDYPSLC